MPQKFDKDIENRNTIEESELTNSFTEKPKNRNSYHQNVEEALSSLLWQPYEYQNNNNTPYDFCGNGNYEESYSSCSYTPSSSPLSLDLDDNADSTAATSPSSTKRPAPSPTLPRCTAVPPRDLHSDVINLERTPYLHQWDVEERSRGRSLRRSSSAAVPLASSHSDAIARASTVATPPTSCSDACTSAISGSFNMQNGASTQTGVTDGGSQQAQALKPPTDNSLNAVNIVGLPRFQNGHIAASRSQNSAAGYPQHFRNVSEPATQFFRYPSGGTVPTVHQKTQGNSVGSGNPTDQHNLQLINHFRSSSVPKSIALASKYDVTTSSGPQNNLRTSNSSTLLQTPSVVNNNGVQANATRLLHTRSLVSPQSSAQEDGGIQNVKPSPTKSLPSSILPAAPNNANISNINVNFYRAVPVNVVGSVPTIHCMNTLSNNEGNSVSNVQVLPLGNNNQQLALPNAAHSSFVNSAQPHGLSNRTGIHSTQVTVRNTNAIQIGHAAVDSKILTTTVGYPESSYKNTVSGTTVGNVIIHNGTESVRSASGLQVTGISGQEVNRAALHNKVVPTTTTNLFTGDVTHTAGVPVSNNVVQIQTNAGVNAIRSPVFISEVPYQQGGRIITTTAQINSNAMEGNVSNATQGLNNSYSGNGTNIVRTRTFTSTEAQTDDILPVTQCTLAQNQPAREQRRRERRERRQNRRANSQLVSRNTHDSGIQTGSTNITPSHNNQSSSNESRLPDILNSHLPPPYTPLPNAQNTSLIPPVPPQILPPPPPPMVPGAVMPNHHASILQTVVPNGVPASAFVFPAPQQMAPLMQGAAPVPVAVPATAAGGFRFGLAPSAFRRSRFSEDSPKGCCGFLSWKPGSLRWFIALIALVAVCCVLVGTALGAMRPAGRDHLTVSLLMIGVGIVLITVSGVAWRLTSHDSSTCRSMLGLGSTESVDVCTRRFVPRLPPSYGRPHHPYAAMMYPEFQYRPPPPSYQASMQEYRLRLLLLDRGNTPQIQAGIQNAVSPPPTYRSHAGSLLRAPLSSRRDATQSEYSCPPSYRSMNSSNRPGTLQNGSILHSRDPSLTLSDSNHESVVNVVNILGSTEEDIALDNITLDSLKMEPESTDINPLKMLLKGSQHELEGSKDGNLVTIVQTNDQSPVIVTVSGCSQDNSSSVQITEIPTEMEILAHL
ncbi:uncharacterized protein LOC115879470 [Sitophilus oryzae]|uniref:Uncharacterized protein LOC115879470 n=1 Tax=Sitophilus oryzae TaxID=7048 RepID=A0A6J2XME2_SITOR|nr:uncharacterized protein LOC115879470 [Sitophilus oryzae]